MIAMAAMDGPYPLLAVRAPGCVAQHSCMPLYRRRLGAQLYDPNKNGLPPEENYKPRLPTELVQRIIRRSDTAYRKPFGEEVTR